MRIVGFCIFLLLICPIRELHSLECINSVDFHSFIFATQCRLSEIME